MSELRVDAKMLADEPVSALVPVLRLLPGWGKVDNRAVHIEQLSCAMTNFVYRCEKKDGTAGGGEHDDVVLLRVYGSCCGLFDRDIEINTFVSVHNAGIGPAPLATFGNGRIEEFLTGFTALTSSNLREEPVSLEIARKMAQFHSEMTSHFCGKDCGYRPAEVVLFDRLRSWYRSAYRLNKAAIVDLGLEGLEDEISAFESAFWKSGMCWVSFCHNDLQHGNIMKRTFNDSQNMPMNATSEPSHEVRFIDYEYSGLCPIAFDIANHFCEWMAAYDSDEPHILHRAWFPTAKQQIEFLTAYFSRLKTSIPACDWNEGLEQKEACNCAVFSGMKSLQCLANSREVEKAVAMLCGEVRKFVPISDLHWGLWALIQDSISNVEFDFRGYAQQRIQAFQNRKN